MKTKGADERWPRAQRCDCTPHSRTVIAQFEESSDISGIYRVITNQHMLAGFNGHIYAAVPHS